MPKAVVATVNKAERIAIVVTTTRNNLPDMEADMTASEWFRTKVKKHDYYAQNLYSALCNNDFQKLEVVPILKDQTWSCSWRYAGGLVARIQNKGDYLNWYCSGMGGLATDDDFNNDEYMSKKQHVPEGVVSDEIREDLKILGWIVVNSD